MTVLPPPEIRENRAGTWCRACNGENPREERFPKAVLLASGIVFTSFEELFTTTFRTIFPRGVSINSPNISIANNLSDLDARKRIISLRGRDVLANVSVPRRPILSKVIESKWKSLIGNGRSPARQAEGSLQNKNGFFRNGKQYGLPPLMVPYIKLGIFLR